MEKNKKTLIYFVLLSICTIATLFPYYASAYTVPTTAPIYLSQDPPTSPTPGKIHVCPGTFVSKVTGVVDPSIGLTSRLIPCIRDSIIFATVQLMIPIFAFFQLDIMFATTTLAIIAFGIFVMSGGGNITQGAIMLLLKIGAMFFVMYNAEAIYLKMLDAVEELLNLLATPAAAPFLPAGGGGIWRDTVTAGTNNNNYCAILGTFQESEKDIMTIWNILDCYIDLLVGGVFASFSLNGGLIGFIMSMMVSSATGVLVGLAGIYLIIIILQIVARSVYIFITAYVAFSFMAIISAFVIPCILFKSTKEYFDSWLRLTLSFMLQPVFSFGYLIMFLVAVNVTIFNGQHSLYYAIAGDNSDITANPKFRLGAWLEEMGVMVEATKLPNNYNVNAQGSKAELNGAPITPLLTAVEGTLGANPPLINASSTNPQGEHEFGDSLTGILNYFQTGVEVETISWEELSSLADSAGWTAINSGGPPTKETLDQFTLQFKVRVFVAFISAFVTMYIFHSLLQHIPFIGSGSSGSDSRMALGAGNSIMGRGRARK